MLILSTEGLRSRPQATLDAVCHFLSLPRINVTSLPEKDAIERLLQFAYPQFGPRTGWRLEGEYDKMPPQVAEKLKQFFQPYNSALFRYLGDESGGLLADWASAMQ